MISKELLLTIPELNLRGRINSMTEGQVVSYVQSLNSFVDRFPSLAERLQHALDGRAYQNLADTLATTCDSLTKIHADELVKECRKHIATVKSANAASFNYDGFEAFVEDFIQRVSSMSIEVRMAAHKSVSGAAQWKRGSGSSGRGSVILAVDNAVMFLNTMQKYLKDDPYDLHCLTSCAEALEYLDRNRPDAILLDVEMPEMDGYELARRIKSGGHKAPIIFITAHFDDKYVDKAIEVGAAGLLIKPLCPTKLREKLREVI